MLKPLVQAVVTASSYNIAKIGQGQVQERMHKFIFLRRDRRSASFILSGWKIKTHLSNVLDFTEFVGACSQNAFDNKLILNRWLCLW